jgi:quercetin dioxygenase-like cupin family protein
LILNRHLRGCQDRALIVVHNVESHPQTPLLESSGASSRPASTIPADNPGRDLTLARPNEDRELRHISLAGDTYTILLTGENTVGRYCLIDMHVPPGGGPPPYRHDFEEMFTVLEGGIEVTFRGGKWIAGVGETVNLPANAPHEFHNKTDRCGCCACARRLDRKSFSWPSALANGHDGGERERAVHASKAVIRPLASGNGRNDPASPA